MFRATRETTTRSANQRVGRRQILGLARTAAALLAGTALARSWPLASLESRAAASRAPNVPTQAARITIDLPPVYEDGNSVPLGVLVAGPMTPSDHVQELHIVAPGNPLPEVARIRFPPRNGRAELRTRIRLDAGLQMVVVTAIFADGSAETATASSQIAAGGCSAS